MMKNRQSTDMYSADLIFVHFEQSHYDNPQIAAEHRTYAKP